MKKLLKYPLFFVSGLLLVGSAFILPDMNATPFQPNVQASDTIQDIMTVIDTRCFVCHNPDMKTENRLAPPMYMVRSHYYNDTISRENFIEQMTVFALKPDLEKSVMPGAVRNFGLMPQSSFDENEVRLIAGYIYDTDLQSDAWFKSWKKFKKAQLISK